MCHCRARGRLAPGACLEVGGHWKGISEQSSKRRPLKEFHRAAAHGAERNLPMSMGAVFSYLLPRPDMGFYRTRRTRQTRRTRRARRTRRTHRTPRTHRTHRTPIFLFGIFFTIFLSFLFFHFSSFFCFSHKSRIPPGISAPPRCRTQRGNPRLRLHTRGTGQARGLLIYIATWLAVFLCWWWS